MEILKVQQELRSLKSTEYAAHYQRFFKTGPGEYGFGDVFLGIRVPIVRNLAKKFSALKLDKIKVLLTSSYHEERFLALVILVLQYNKKDLQTKKEIYRFYLKYRKHINNWDLVDTSAHHIVGCHLYNKKDRIILNELAQSNLLWDRRIAIIATFYFIKNYQYEDTLRLSRLLLFDKEDLIHKAVGWMLREIGKRNSSEELTFLDQYAHKMPRVMLRYAIEQLPEKKRKEYLKYKM